MLNIFKRKVHPKEILPDKPLEQFEEILFKIDMIITEWYYNHSCFIDTHCPSCHNKLTNIWYETLQPYDDEWRIVCNNSSCISKIEEVWDRGNTIGKPEIKVIKYEKGKDAVFVKGWSGNKC